MSARRRTPAALRAAAFAILSFPVAVAALDVHARAGSNVGEGRGGRLGVAVAISLGPGDACAQSYWPGVVDTVEVRARRYDARDELARRSGFATVIPLGVEAPAGRDLADLLDRTAGVQVRRYGGFGAFSQAAVRGSTPGQVLVCLDGVPIASAGDGFVDLALLPVSLFGHAELFRGAQTASFGGPPAAGVINLVTPSALVTPLRLTTGGGSFGTSFARGLWGGARGPFSLYLAGQLRRSRGDFEYRNRNGTHFGNTADDRDEKRRNNGFEDRALLVKGTLRGPRGPGVPKDGSPPGGSRAEPFLRSLRLDVTTQLFARDGGVPGTENVQTEKTRFRVERSRHELAASGVIPSAWPLRLEGAWHEERIRDRFDNPIGEVGLGRAATDNRTTERGGRAAAHWSLAPWRQELRASVQSRTERWTPHDRLRGTVGFARTRRHRTVSLEDRLHLGRIRIEAALHRAEAEDNYAGPVGWGRPARPSELRTRRFETPVFGARADLGRGAQLKANRGRFARFPSFPELFGQNGTQEGNPALRPETGRQWDAGLSWSPSLPLRAEAAYFESRTKDRITLLQNSQRTVKAMNLDRAWVRGVESSCCARVAATRRLALELQASYTWQEARDVGPSPTYRGKRLPHLPDREGFVSLACERAPWRARWDLSARSSHYRDRYNSPARRTPPSTVHAASLERSLFRNALRLRAEVQNLFDRRVQDVDGFPLPGRSYLAELTWTR